MLTAVLSYSFLADSVLALHVALVVFVVGGLLATIVGNLCGWRWANAWWFRLLHAAAIATVVAESWLGIACPLTTLEQWLRTRGGLATHGAGFLQHALQSLLYWDAPAWVFTIAYTVFGLAVLAVWLRWPPVRQQGPVAPLPREQALRDR